MNNKYYIKIEHPSVKLTIETEVNEKNVRRVINKLINIVQGASSTPKHMHWETIDGGVVEVFSDGTRKPADPNMFGGDMA